MPLWLSQKIFYTFIYIFYYWGDIGLIQLALYFKWILRHWKIFKGIDVLDVMCNQIVQYLDMPLYLEHQLSVYHTDLEIWELFDLSSSILLEFYELIIDVCFEAH